MKRQSKYDKRFNLFLAAVYVIVSILLYASRVEAKELNEEPVPVGYSTIGKLSYYGYSPWYYTIKWYQENWEGYPSDEVIAQYDGTIAVEPCHAVGWHGTLTVLEWGTPIATLSVIAIDCAGEDAYDENGVSWLERDGFAGEMGWEMYNENREWYNDDKYQGVLTLWPR